MIQQQKKIEFMKIRMIGNMAMMQYASKFTELLRFILDFIATETIKRFKEGLAFYIKNQLVKQAIQTYQELYEQVAKVERVKNKLSL